MEPRTVWWKRPHLIFSIFILVVFFSSWLFALHLHVSDSLGHYLTSYSCRLGFMASPPMPLHIPPPAIPSGFTMLTKYREVAKVGRSKWGVGHRVHRQSLTCCLCCSSFMRLMYITREGVESMGIFICTRAYICICIFCQRVVKNKKPPKPWVSPLI